MFHSYIHVLNEMTENGLSMACDLRLCLRSENKEHKIFVDYWAILKRQKSSYVSGLSVYIFVAMWLGVFVCVL